MATVAFKTHLHILVPHVGLAISLLNLLEKPFARVCIVIICCPFLFNVFDDVADSMLFIEFKVFVMRLGYMLRNKLAERCNR